jgi:hypothetical protein
MCGMGGKKDGRADGFLLSFCDIYMLRCCCLHYPQVPYGHLFALNGRLVRFHFDILVLAYIVYRDICKSIEMCQRMYEKKICT